MVTRRNVLMLIGGGTVLAAGSAGGFVLSNGPSTEARRPWREAGRYDDFRKRALSYALLAPNPHNLQPWKVELVGDDALTFYPDPDRKLPATDPFDRQITIGCGAFLELLRLAAAEEGYGTELDLFPEGSNMSSLASAPIAHVRFLPGQADPDPLFTQVLKRRSNKEVYAPKDVEPDKLAALVQTGTVYGQKIEVTGNTPLAAKLRELTWQAHKLEVTTDYTNQESVDLMRIGAREVRENPDGIELEGPMIAAGKLVGMVNRESLADPTSAGFKQGLAMYEGMAMSARAFLWLTNDDTSRRDQIDAGRAYVRLNLKATELGLGIHPWSQSLQEYPEMTPLYEEVHDLIGEGKRLQMLVRVGYGPDVIATPRRGLNAHLV
ncbi:Acg family FMN-binding oxidoreductase [Henriciella marina]|uniref:Acg family FMN-binding oxidoreductase n=1 Tax=Henriciella marina TaxID=453851 RepID=UPI00037544BA|nr:nitroreductase family protein [Henriciella marina]